MPKYFAGEKNLPYSIARINISELSKSKLELLFHSTAKLSICILQDGLDDSSLGYVANISKEGEIYTLINIALEVELKAKGVDSLCAVLRHICGAEYLPKVQELFQKNRNNIGSTIRNDIFSLELKEFQVQSV